MRKLREQGIALITTLFILLLLSTMIAGIAWLVMGDQKLGGNNADRQLAFYGAEAGMESLSASLENLFNANYAPDRNAINNLLQNPGPPANIPGVQFIAPGQVNPGTGYQITFTPNPNNNNLPNTSWGTIPTGTYAGLVGLMTPYTLTVTARTPAGSEARLQREVQTVGIPVFQFGFFSQMDLSFFAGPNFNFGGRVHTNGNLWLAEGDNSTLTMSQKVTAAGEIITENLENGWLQTNTYNGAVNITNGSGVNNLIAQNPNQSVTGNANVYGNIGAYTNAFAGMASTYFNNDIAVAQTGVKPLNLSIATPAIAANGSTIDLIRRPMQNENNSGPAELAERYYSQVSLRVLLSDYGADGKCDQSDISSTSATALPLLAPNVANSPVDLATLSWDTSYAPGGGHTGAPYNAAPGWLANVGAAPGQPATFPLPTSSATGAQYNSGAIADGYWVQKWFPIISGCIKIDYQKSTSTVANPVWIDVTTEILNLGYTGRNLWPQSAATMGSAGNQSPHVLALPTTQVASSGPTANGGVGTVGCNDPSQLAVIRLARVRDNPSFVNGVGGCGTPNAANGQHGSDYWPNVLFDTREALLRDNALGGTQLPLEGAMYYVELDINNLTKWFRGTIGASGANVLATNGYSIYFSDRRSEQTDPNPPPSVSSLMAAPGAALTGGVGYDDIVNSSDANGCPSVAPAAPELAEDFEDDNPSTSGTVKTYGNLLNPPAPRVPAAGGWYVMSNGAFTPTNMNTFSALANYPTCAGLGVTWPYAVATGSDLRENPPIFFRRALKVVHGDTISLGTCNSVPCGLAVIAENPAYVYGCYNNSGSCGANAFGQTTVGASVIADAVTLLSDNWNDINSFAFPYGKNNGGFNVTNGGRNAVTTTYRVAVAAGKGIPFKQPTVGAPPKDFGTDGGAHNFLRYIENWGGQTLYYQGSIVSMWYNHQAVGLYKCCNTVYSPPSRGYQFDTNFLTPSLLPPLTPMLRTVNTIGFTQMLLPTQ
ncbi:MAG TPA: PilX N-terminal domain-containing pilus assembly protein [Candidatus Acidoferrum sp.]|nr:PilX N-terminal domain-containing pilus assembly protein [Candidatus Acidoferrum sp.]